MRKHSRLKKLAKHLLATTCLTAGAVAMANAQTVNEGSGAAGDFGNALGSAFSLPVGTTTVTGHVGGNVQAVDNFLADPADFFTFAGLQPGSAFSFTGTVGNSGGSPHVIVESDQGTALPGSPFAFLSNENFGVSGSGIVPLDGSLVFGIGQSIEFQDPYSLSLTATLTSTTPEPGTIALAGLGLAAAGFLRRRKK